MLEICSLSSTMHQSWPYFTKVIQKVKEASARGEKQWLIVSRKLDETDMDLRFGTELSATLRSWILSRISATGEALGLTPDASRRICSEVMRQNEGSVTVLAQERMLCQNTVPRTAEAVSGKGDLTKGA